MAGAFVCAVVRDNEGECTRKKFIVALDGTSGVAFVLGANRLVAPAVTACVAQLCGGDQRIARS